MLPPQSAFGGTPYKRSGPLGSALGRNGGWGYLPNPKLMLLSNSSFLVLPTFATMFPGELARLDTPPMLVCEGCFFYKRQ